MQTRKISNKLVIAGLVIFILLVLALAYWFFIRTSSQSSSGSVTSTPIASPSASQSAAKETTPPDTTEIEVEVYFSKHPESDSDPTKVFPVDRTATDNGVAKLVLSELIKGPSTEEKDDGFYTEIKLSGKSNCGGDDFKVTISGGKATVQFCKVVVQAGTLSDARSEAQIQATLTQFPTVQKVIILNKNGNCLFGTSGENLCLKE